MHKVSQIPLRDYFKELSEESGYIEVIKKKAGS